MRTEIVIDLTAWKIFKTALEGAIGQLDDDEPFNTVRNMLLIIEEANPEPEPAQ